MADTTATIDIIGTKLHRPPVTQDLVPRTALLNQLDHYRQRPLTVVSAPAGYGKSTLVSSWLEVSECPGAWVSLDRADPNGKLYYQTQSAPSGAPLAGRFGPGPVFFRLCSVSSQRA